MPWLEPEFSIPGYQSKIRSIYRCKIISFIYHILHRMHVKANHKLQKLFSFREYILLWHDKYTYKHVI